VPGIDRRQCFALKIQDLDVAPVRSGSRVVIVLSWTVIGLGFKPRPADLTKIVTGTRAGIISQMGWPGMPWTLGFR